MSSEEQIPDTSEKSILVWLESADVQRRAALMATRLAKNYGLPMTGSDLYQIVVERFIRYSTQKPLKPIDHPLAYLYRVLVNQAREISKKDPSSKTVPLSDLTEDSLTDNFETAQRLESGILLREVLDSIDEKEREIFTLWLGG